MSSIVLADLCDAHENERYKTLHIVDPSLNFKSYGGKSAFGGQIETVKCFEDNSFVKEILQSENGKGKVLVVDGGGSMRCALVGDLIAASAVKNEWEGILVYGCIRDSKEIAKLPILIKALNTNPIRSIKKNQGEKNVAVSFGSVLFQPGDYVYADEDGVIVSSKKLV